MEVGPVSKPPHVIIHEDEREPVREILAQWQRNVGDNLTTWNAPIARLLERLGAA